ncbi:hypothetical protein KKG46_02145 [Patescibacteria group bacterium]|nr:hypothetical protein [Patescibacteria group bacterium]
MDQGEIRDKFFADRDHDMILYSTPLEASPLANMLKDEGLNNFFDIGLDIKEITVFGRGKCPIFIFGSEWIMEKDLNAVDALNHLLTCDISRQPIGKQLAYQACLFFAKPDLVKSVVKRFLEYLKRQRTVLTSRKGDSYGYYTDMIKHEVLTYAYYSREPLPKVPYSLN